MKNTILALSLFLLSLTCYSSNAKFYSINSLYGISMREVASVCKDKNGFIWASSKTGIIRLTRGDYRIYQLPYENTDIYSVKLVYSNSSLFAYTNNGQLFLYNAINDRFDLLVSVSTVLKNRYLTVKNVITDSQGSFWIASSFGVYRYRKGRITLIGDSKEAYYVAPKDSQRIFVSSVNGICILNKLTLKQEWIYRDESKLSLHVSKLFYDYKERKLWIGTILSGLYFYDFAHHRISGVQTQSFPKQPVLAIESGTDSTLLVGVDGQGMWEVSKDGRKVLNVCKENADDPYSLHGNGVYDILNDNNKRIWICTYSGGLSFFDQQIPLVDQLSHKINTPGSLGNDNVNKVIQDKRGKIWFATDNGISCFEPTTRKWKVFYHNMDVQARVFLSICEDSKGNIWAGTYSSGIYVLDGESGRELAHYSDNVSGNPLLRSNFIHDIFKDSQGDIWLGGIVSNIICYQNKEKNFRIYPNEPVYGFAELNPQKILLACAYGLLMLDKKSGKIEHLLDGYLVQDVLVVKDDIWICTSGEGLIRYNPKTRKILKVKTDSGLPSNYVNSIMYADSYLWIGTENGLCRFDPKDKGVLTYNSIYSLSHLSFNRSSNCQLDDGQLIWGTNNGAVSFFPDALTKVQTHGKIFFQEMTIAGRSIRGTLDTPLDSLLNLELGYNQNTLNLELLSIGNVSGTKYSWRLEGLDNEWSLPSDNRFVNYSNIPSGNYTLKIRLYDSSLSKVIAERTLNLTIVPPFWKTWWFRLFVFLLTVGIIYFILNYYIERLKQQHTEEKVRFFTNTAHDIRTSLTLIKAPIEELTKESDLSNLGRHYLSLATEQARRLSTVVTQLMDFQKMDIGKEQLVLNMVDIVALVEHRCLMFESYAKSKNIELRFTSEQECYQSAIDEAMMEKVIDNLISNAIKYSNSDNLVEIGLSVSPENWVLEVKDHGIGISKKAQRQLFREFYRGENAINSKIVGSGIGLLLVKNYVALHGGDISCESQENVGSSFRLVIPFKEVVEDETSVKVEVPGSAPYVVPEMKSQLQTEQQELPKREMRILIVEDNDDLRNFMRYPLQAEFEILLAEDGVEAWEIIQKQMPDLVVSDVMMPNMDGFELCRLMKSTYETSHIPLILLTALSGKAEQLHGLGLGADDYLTKPFDMTLLVQRIKSIIRNRCAVKDKALKLIKVPVNNNDQILTNELNDKFLKKMLEVVRANISNTEFGKEGFSGAMNVSPSLLYKKVKALTDQSPTDFIKIVRLDYALELLQSRKHNVTEVSELCGFSTIGYFSTVFKKHFGKSPTEI